MHHRPNAITFYTHRHTLPPVAYAAHGPKGPPSFPANSAAQGKRWSSVVTQTPAPLLGRAFAILAGHKRAQPLHLMQQALQTICRGWRRRAAVLGTGRQRQGHLHLLFRQPDRGRSPQARPPAYPITAPHDLTQIKNIHIQVLLYVIDILYATHKRHRRSTTHDPCCPRIL